MSTQTLPTPSSKPMPTVLNVVLWVLQILAAAAFLMAGYMKLSGKPAMVGEFEQIGLGQWFRYVTGIIEVGSAILMLIPRTIPIGAALLACTMFCAIQAHFFKIGGNPGPAIVLLAITATIAFSRRKQILR